MTHARARLALLALVVAGVLGVLLPTQASALVSYYSCANKPPFEWCDGRANGSFDGLHSWDYNKASTSTSGLNVCQGLYRPSTGIWLSGHGCAMNWTANIYVDQSCACLEANIAQTSASPQSINGFADTEAPPWP